jgi:hypothetical protein
VATVDQTMSIPVLPLNALKRGPRNCPEAVYMWNESLWLDPDPLIITSAAAAAVVVVA